MSMRFSLPVVVLALLVGCSSPPTRYYVLSRVSGSPLPAVGATAVRVDRVRIPSELDRSQIVSRLDDNRLQVASTSRWAAPLNEMIRRVLSADLAARLPQGLVIDPYQPTQGRVVGSLTVNIDEFYGNRACEVSLRAAWLLTRPQAAALAAMEEVHVAPKGKCPDVLAATMSEALGELSDRIAAAVAGSRS
jgi:uncharacterized lipoprotein YmbA